MKYAQFVELKEKHSNVLNEVFGINKWLMSVGVKSIYTSQLEKQAEKLKVDIQDTLKKSLQNYVNAKKEIKVKVDELKQNGEQVPAMALRQMANIEAEIVKTVSTSVQKFTKLMTDQVDEKIDGSKKLKPSHKLALKYMWNKLKTDVEVEALSQLMKNNVIENPDIVGKVEDRNKKLETDIKTQGQDLTTKIKELQKKEGTGEGGNKEGVVQSSKDPGADKKPGTADDAIIDPDGKGATEINTPYLNEFTITSPNSSLKLKYAGLYQDWKKIFNIVEVKGKLAEDKALTPSDVLVFNKQKIKVGEQVRFDVYDFNTGEYKNNVVINNPSKITDYVWTKNPAEGDKIKIPAPPDDLNAGVEKLGGEGDGNEKPAEEKKEPQDKVQMAKDFVDKAKAKFQKERADAKGDSEKLKKINQTQIDFMKKFAEKVNSIKEEKIKNEIIEYTESKIKGSQKSLFPDYRPSQPLTSDEDAEITK